MSMTRRTVFDVPGMDCPSEERIIRMALDSLDGVDDLRFDLPSRTIAIIHQGAPERILAKLEPLGFGARVSSTGDAGLPTAGSEERAAEERQTLRVLLAINAAMFLIEAIAGWLGDSSGLIADSLDMLADALVYGLSLHAVGGTSQAKLRAAHVSGVFQAVLAVGVLADIGRRAIQGSSPEPPAMIGISALALAANVACLLLIAKHRDGGAHMKASWIFSTNDVLANLGVIVAGALVAWTGSHVPDLAIGAVVAATILFGAYRIHRLR